MPSGADRQTDTYIHQCLWMKRYQETRRAWATGLHAPGLKTTCHFVTHMISN